MKRLADVLKGNSYPGRGIVLGRHADGRRAVLAYFIMGRSENSRNRVFVKLDEEIRTQAFDPSRLTDPSLVIYTPVRVFRGQGIQEPPVTIVTNGDQTDTIYNALSAGRNFEDALRTRSFEPDGPIYTPRISGVLQGFSYKLSILKSAYGNPESPQRFFFEFRKPLAGMGHLIHTYRCDGDPVPSFSGEPVPVEISGEIDEFTGSLWESLDSANKVSLFTRFIDVETGETQSRIVNKHESNT